MPEFHYTHCEPGSRYNYRVVLDGREMGLIERVFPEHGRTTVPTWRSSCSWPGRDWRIEGSAQETRDGAAEEILTMLTAAGAATFEEADRMRGAPDETD